MVQYKMLAEWLKARTESERGAALVEYALLVALIAVVCIVAIQALGSEAKNNFEDVASSIKVTTP